LRHYPNQDMQDSKSFFNPYQPLKYCVVLKLQLLQNIFSQNKVFLFYFIFMNPIVRYVINLPKSVLVKKFQWKYPLVVRSQCLHHKNELFFTSFLKEKFYFLKNWIKIVCPIIGLFLILREKKDNGALIRVVVEHWSMVPKSYLDSKP